MRDRPTGERWRRIEELYHAAIELPAAEREAFLNATCDNDEPLRLEVEALLAVARDAEPFLEEGIQIGDVSGEVTASFIGRRIGPYEVKALLGVGGMGEVYRATDRRLGRDVAVKVLRGDLNADADRLDRFEQEARAAAALNHPNILAVFDIGRHDGGSYLVSELLEGETLRDLLRRGAPPIRQVVEYGVQIATGLAAAHDKGIVHRDIKPENIFVTTDGRIKLLDFGIAKLIESTAHTMAIQQGSATTPGALIGTVGYMSPEQVRGQQIDHRSDIFSFGAVLYELVTGFRAFGRETAPETLTAILNDEPPGTAADSPATARALKVARRCLEKSATARFQSCRDLALVLSDELADRAPAVRPRVLPSPVVIAAALVLLACVAIVLRVVIRSRAPSESTRIGSLAVLPLESLSAGADSGYLADGMTAALITNLAKIRALRVVSRTSVMRYKGVRKALPQIGRELNVDAIVAGTIEQIGERVRIDVELIRASTDEHLWADTYDRDIRDVLRLQDQVAQSVARAVRVTLTPEEHARLAKGREVDPEAYRLYVKGRFFWDRRTEESINRAIAFFKEAIERDPTYAAAYSGLADCYLSLGFSFDVGSLPPSDAIPKAKAAVVKALALDDMLAEAHNSLAYAKLNFDWDWPGAEAEFKRSLELNPGYTEAHHWYSHFLASSGRLDESLAESNRALELDLLSPIINVHLGWTYIFARQYDQALTQLAKTIELDSNYGLAYWFRGLAYEQQHKYSEALEEMRKGARLLKTNVVVAADIGHVHAVSGDRGDATMIIRELQEQSTRRFVSPFELAIIYIGLGETDRAFEWLEKAYQARSDLLVYLNVDPRLDPIRTDRRFSALVDRVGVPK
jgi:serine/threonine protein kinase/tetratricopeptide (TPR) repeat protein